MGGKKAQQRTFVVGICGDSTYRRILLSPYFQMHSCRDNVFVGNADIGSFARSLIVRRVVSDCCRLNRKDWFVSTLGNSGNDNGTAIDMKCLETDGRWWRAVFISRGVHHEDFFFRTYACHDAVIAHANEQPSASSVGEGRDGARKLHGVSDFVFEVLLTVLALVDECLKVSVGMQSL